MQQTQPRHWSSQDSRFSDITPSSVLQSTQLPLVHELHLPKLFMTYDVFIRQTSVSYDSHALWMYVLYLASVLARAYTKVNLRPLDYHHSPSVDPVYRVSAKLYIGAATNCCHLKRRGWGWCVKWLECESSLVSSSLSLASSEFKSLGKWGN